jgi:regulator of chromosome condensation
MRFVSLAAGRNHMLALTSDGRVYSWGDSAYSSLGRRISTRTPHACLVPERIAELSDIVNIGSGAHHCFAVSKDGKVFSWGLNDYGQCGVTSIGTCVEFPVQIEFGKGKRIREIRAGRYTSAFLLDNGKVFMFGRKEWLGIGGKKIEKVTTEPDENKGIRRSTRVTVQSSSIDPTLNTSSSAVSSLTTPTLVHTKASYRSIAVGYAHALASTNCWNSHSWGCGAFYALANTPTSRVLGADEYTPYAINDRNLAGFKVVAVGAGTQHSVALAWREQQYTLVS